MPDAKITGDLEEQLLASSPGELVEVVIELRHARRPDAPRPQAPTSPAGRTAAIAERRQIFQSAAEPVARAVEECGGEVRERAWINWTLRARLAAEGIRKVAELEDVEHVDVPHRITLEV